MYVKNGKGNNAEIHKYFLSEYDLTQPTFNVDKF